MASDLYYPALLQKSHKRFKYIIIHDTSCQWENFDSYKVDRRMFQSGLMRKKFRSMKEYHELPYHFICEKIGEEYQTIVGMPLQYRCWKEYPDIDRAFSENAIHVCLMGNYNVLTHSSHMYQQLCYRVLCPMMKTFKITKGRIFLHGDLSKSHCDCPGYNFNKNLMFAYMSKYLMGAVS